MIIGVLSWIPRSLQRGFESSYDADWLTYYVSYLPVDLSGIVFAIVFFLERRSLAFYMDTDNSSPQRMSFVWEQTDYEEDGLDTTLSPFQRDSQNFRLSEIPPRQSLTAAV